MTHFQRNTLCCLLFLLCPLFLLVNCSGDDDCDCISSESPSGGSDSASGNDSVLTPSTSGTLSVETTTSSDEPITPENNPEDPRPGKYLITGSISLTNSTPYDTCPTQVADTDIYVIQTGAQARLRLVATRTFEPIVDTDFDIYLVQLEQPEQTLDLSCQDSDPAAPKLKAIELFRGYAGLEADSQISIYDGEPVIVSAGAELHNLTANTFYALLIFGRKGTPGSYTIALDLRDEGDGGSDSGDAAGQYIIPGEPILLNEPAEVLENLADNRLIVR
jgi:hypothetical protein